MSRDLNVTKTFFPPIDEYRQLLERVWKNEWLTNRGELVLELEQKLKDYLGISNILLTNNGTIPLQIALKLLGKAGEIITTPFSYVATTSSIIWENCHPVFVDIDPGQLTIDASKIEAAITDKTTCILATHVFGNLCDVEVIEKIAAKHNLKVIYDAAHSFGVTLNGISAYEFGDVATTSFHATKLFHTGEGGAIFCKDEVLRNQIFYSHNFGHNGPLDFHGLGINGKISELQAAMGLAVLPHMNEILDARKFAVNYYRQHLNWGRIKTMEIRKGIDWNYSYFPIIFQDEAELLKVQKALNQESIFPRRYFYPSLNTIQYVSGPSMPVSETISSRILCLPLSASISEMDLERIVKIIKHCE